MIRIAEDCGLCVGARKSIDVAEAALREGAAFARPVVLYKELLHNDVVMEDLLQRGALCVHSPDDIPPNALVVVRAHGEGKSFYDFAARENLTLRDATCANVKKIHELVRRAHREGKAVVIFGKRGHAETEGVRGWCPGAAVVETEADIDALPDAERGTENAGLFAVCQTTIARDRAERLLARLRERFPERTVEFADTVCAAPLRIHAPSLRLAEECDVLFTIGGAASANTAELRRYCEQAGCASCPPQIASCRAFAAYLDGHAPSLRPGLRYGFTAGASTPRAEVEKCRDLLAFRLVYAGAKARLEAKMAAFNDSFARTGADDSDPAENRIVREAGAHFAAVNSGGKYLRGVLAVLGHAIARGEAGESLNEAADETADALALAFEVFQTAVLIHDDLIDNAALRRGRKTIPARYADAATGNAMAVCIGDWGLFESIDILARAYAGAPRFGALLRFFINAVRTTIQGEILDTVLPFEQRSGIAPETGSALLAAIRDIQRRKTAWYTTIGPLLCGMILGGASDEARGLLFEFADNLGIAFQIQDDILGVFGDAATLGKDVGSDIAEYKQTLLYAFTQTLSPPLFRELRSYYGKADPSPADLERVRGIFTESGALAAAAAERDRCFARARDVLDSADFLSDEHRSILRGAVLHLSLRER